MLVCGEPAALYVVGILSSTTLVAPAAGENKWHFTRTLSHTYNLTSRMRLFVRSFLQHMR